MRYKIIVRVSPSVIFQPNGFSYEYNSNKAIDALIDELKSRLFYQRKKEQRRK